MRKWKVTTLAGMLAMVAFVGTPTEASETIKKIKDRGTLQVCMAETRPRAVRNPATGQWAGYNIELAKDLANELGVKLELVDQPYATILPALLSGKCDIIMAPLLANTARAQAVAFTEFYSESGNQAVVRQDAKFETWEQLNDANVTFAVASGTQDEVQVKKLFPKAKVKPVVSDNTYSFFLELAAGRADASFPDRGSAQLFIKQNPQMKLRVLQPERISSAAGRGFAIRPDDWHFLNFLNVWLWHAKDKYSQE